MWDTLTMFEAMVCGRSWVRSPTRGNIVGWVFHPTRWLARFSLIWTCLSFQILNLFRTLSSWGSGNYRPSAPLLYEVASHVKQLPFRPILSLFFLIIMLFRKVGGIDLLSFTDLRCVLSFYRVQSALKVTILHQYASFFYMCWCGMIEWTHAWKQIKVNLTENAWSNLLPNYQSLWSKIFHIGGKCVTCVMESIILPGQ